MTRGAARLETTATVYTAAEPPEQRHRERGFVDAIPG